jgi:O-acetylhomoserine/O-acetylserine sulfhydrylase-like pyridoxal-dependent enzyme
MCSAALPFDVNERNRAEALACTLSVINSTQLMSSATNLANVENIVTHRAAVPHACLTEAQRSSAGTLQNLTRAAVKPKHIHDLKAGLLGSLDTLQ